MKKVYRFSYYDKFASGEDRLNIVAEALDKEILDNFKDNYVKVHSWLDVDSIDMREVEYSEEEYKKIYGKIFENTDTRVLVYEL